MHVCIQVSLLIVYPVVFVCVFQYIVYLYCSEKFLTDWDRLHFSDFCQESSLEMSKEGYKAGDDFIVALFNLFSCLNNVPKALTYVLQPYLERAQIWEHLYTLAGKVATSCCIMLEFRGCFFRLT